MSSVQIQANVATIDCLVPDSVVGLSTRLCKIKFHNSRRRPLSGCEIRTLVHKVDNQRAI